METGQSGREPILNPHFAVYGYHCGHVDWVLELDGRLDDGEDVGKWSGRRGEPWWSEAFTSGCNCPWRGSREVNECWCVSGERESVR